MFVLLAAVLLADSSQLVLPALRGFKVVNQTSAGGVTIIEQIPRSETAERWSRMVTIQRFEGLAERVNAAGFLQLIAKGAGESCPGVIVSDIRIVSGTPQLRIDCPLNKPTGHRETFIMRAVAGSTDMHVYQVAWRREPWPADVQWGMTYLNGVKLKR